MDNQKAIGERGRALDLIAFIFSIKNASSTNPSMREIAINTSDKYFFSLIVIQQ